MDAWHISLARPAAAEMVDACSDWLLLPLRGSGYVRY